MYYLIKEKKVLMFKYIVKESVTSVSMAPENALKLPLTSLTSLCLQTSLTFFK